MTTSSPVSRRKQALYANAIRNRREPEVIEEAKREFGAARIEDYITKVLAEFPPLTAQQCDRLGAILRGRPE